MVEHIVVMLVGKTLPARVIKTRKFYRKRYVLDMAVG